MINTHWTRPHVLGIKVSMWRFIALYGVSLAVIAAVLQWAEYSYFVRTLPREAFIGLLALIFVGIGIWVGIRIAPRHVAGSFEPNIAAVESLKLTPRECEMLHALARGQSNKEIARSLGVSPNTVKTHIGHLYAKMGVSSRGKAVDAARNLSLIP